MIALRLLISCLRYRRDLARPVGALVRACRCEAQALADREDRNVALRKLDEERFNAEAAAMAATVCPAAHRKLAAYAIVSLELMFDCLDGLTERPSEDPLRDGERLHAPFVRCLAPPPTPPHRDPADRASIEGYLDRLAQSVRCALSMLPGHWEIASVALRCAAHAAEAQVRMHAVEAIGSGPLETWARREAQPTRPGRDDRLSRPLSEREQGTSAWRDFAASAACSMLALHALIAAASDPRLSEADAERIHFAYMPLCAAVTLLDGVIDARRDEAARKLSYAGLYATEEQLVNALLRATREGIERCSTLPHAAHHEMIAAAALAYEISNGSRDMQSATIVSEILAEHRTTLRAPLAVLSTWRALRQARERAQPQAHGEASRTRQTEPPRLHSRSSLENHGRERLFTC